MRYYQYNDDWISHLESEFRSDLISTINALQFERIQKYPPPKLTGLPIGNEPRIISRFLRGESSQLDASAFSSLYRSFMTDNDRLIYRAFRQNEFLPRQKWATIIREQKVDLWLEHKCLAIDKDGFLQCQFSVVSIGGLIFAADPLNDHGKILEPEFLVEADGVENDGLTPFFHTYIGLDSLRMIEIMEGMPLPTMGRYLDCGPGSGGLLLYFSRRYSEAMGIDINPRAAILSQFNADLNGLTNIKTYCDNALELAVKYGRFDLISWNMPFIFMPDKDEKNYVDAFGGEMGIGLCLKFIKTLPEIMTDSSFACLSALAPITKSGENVLESRLADLLPSIGLDCKVQAVQIAVAHNPELWDFHHSYGLGKFESVYLQLTKGTGKLTRTEAPFSRKILDKMRERLYTQKFSK